MKPFNFVLIGRSGSGKGTQARLMLDYFNSLGQSYYYVSSGALFRELSERQSDTGKRIKHILDDGKLPPEEVALALLFYDISFNVNSDQGILIDGAPREVSQAEHTDRFFKFLDRFDNTQVLLIDISREEAIKRLKLRARADDTDQAITNRLDFFDEKVAPVIDYYKNLDKLIVINGQQSVEAIHEDIKKEIQKLTNK